MGTQGVQKITPKTIENVTLDTMSNQPMSTNSYVCDY